MHPLSQEKLPDDILQKYEAEARKGYTITQAMLEIRYHRKSTPISKELVCFAGCVLWGVHGKWTPHVTDFCKIKEFGYRATEDVKKFLSDGLYSFPCVNVRLCRQWLFFRACDFHPSCDMLTHLLQHDWDRVRTSDRRVYFMCPCCCLNKARIAVKRNVDASGEQVDASGRSDAQFLPSWGG